ncbi:hypothetical protein JOD67_005498 [Tenggerimyces flavus]|nr:hypothetical protein [Tenggerimyces flavus]
MTMQPAESPDLRASDEDRDRVADTLREALATGRLSPTEHEERLGAVFAAKTVGELAPITRDLPATRPAAGAIEVAPDERARALFSKVRRVGQWEVPPRFEARATFGAIVLDLRHAQIPHGGVTIVANSAFGKVEIRIPDNARLVGNGGSATFGKRTLPESPASSDDGPVIRITGHSTFGHIRVTRG